MEGFYSYLKSVYIVKRNFEPKYYNIRIPDKTKKEKNELLMQLLPLIISVGTMFAFILIYNIIRSLSSGSGGSLFGSIGFYFVFMLASAISGIVTARIQRNSKEKEEAEIFKEWEIKLKKTETEISEGYQERLDYLNRCYISSESAIMSIVYERSSYLWNVTENHADFLTESLGNASVDSNIGVIIEGDKRNLDAAVLSKVNKMESQYECFINAPFCIDFKLNPYLGIFGENSYRVLTSLLLRICVRHGYDILKCVIISDNSGYKNFLWTRWLPHVWDDVKCYRYILLDTEKNNYFENFESIIESEAKKMVDGFYLPHYLFVISDPQIYLNAKSKKIVDSIIKLVSGNRAAVISVGKKKQDIPSYCTAWIDADSNSPIYYDYNHPDGKGKQFQIPIIGEIAAEKMARGLSRVMLPESDTRIPNKIGFFDMLVKCDKIDKNKSISSNIIDQWSKAVLPSEIQCLFGCVEDEKPLLLSIDRVKHALLAGKTRSGKSQFLMSFIVYLMVTYPPNFVQFLFIDFKGAALSGNFSNAPHCAGAFSDLDKGDSTQIVRLREMLNAEISRREILIKNASIPIQDMEHYNLAVYKSGGNNFIPHLFVIVDEYVELLSQHDEFVKDFERFSRVGASIGIHLILSSQKLDEKVSGQIKTNIDVSICFKVNSAEESKSMIGCSDAKNIKYKGRGFIKTEVDVREFQALWVEKPYMPFSGNNKYGLYTVLLDGRRTRLGVTEQKNQGYMNTELNVLTKELENISNGNQNRIFYDELPKSLFWNKKLYKRLMQDSLSQPFAEFGLSDDFYSNRHSVARINFIGGHYFIAGAAQKGKSTFLQTVIYSACICCDPQRVNFYVCNMQSKMFQPLTKLPHVHDSIIDNTEQFFRLILFLDSTFNERRKLIGEKYESLDEYCKRNPSNPLPQIIVMIDDIDNLIEEYEIVSEKISNLISNSCEKYGISFFVTAKRYNDIRRFSKFFDNRIVFYYPSDANFGNDAAQDLLNDSQLVRKILIQDIPGRCYFNNNGKILVTQVYALSPIMGKTTREVSEMFVSEIMTSIRKDWLHYKPYSVIKRVQNMDVISVLKDHLSNEIEIPLFTDNSSNKSVFMNSYTLNSFFALGEYMYYSKYLLTLIKALLYIKADVFLIDFSDELKCHNIKRKNLYVYNFDNIKNFLQDYDESGDDNIRVIITVGLTGFYESMAYTKRGVLDKISFLLTNIYSVCGEKQRFWIASDTMDNIRIDPYNQCYLAIQDMDCGNAFRKAPRYIEIGGCHDFVRKPPLLDMEYNSRDLPNDQAWFFNRGYCSRVILPLCDCDVSDIVERE